jgi:hypothetical protein
MNANGSRLSGITRDLRGHWQQTKAYWRDARAKDFEDRYLAELYSTVDKTVEVIEQLDKLLLRIKKDCE